MSDEDCGALARSGKLLVQVTDFMNTDFGKHSLAFALARYRIQIPKVRCRRIPFLGHCCARDINPRHGLNIY